MLLRGRFDLGNLRLGLRPDIGDQRLGLRANLGHGCFNRGLDGLLTLLGRGANRLPRKIAQLRLEMLPEAVDRAVERRADLIVEGHGWVSRL